MGASSLAESLKGVLDRNVVSSKRGSNCKWASVFLGNALETGPDTECVPLYRPVGDFDSPGWYELSISPSHDLASQYHVKLSNLKLFH